MEQNPPARRAAAVPEKPSLDGLEESWSRRWDESGVFAFDRTRPRAEVFSIDTPPPTVSGSLHVGHVFSYTHTDTVARYQRMRGRAVFYPMGWDDNGLPTERRVQNYFGVRCDPSLPYDPDFTPPEHPGREQLPISRRNFIELCDRLTEQDEQAFEELWRRLGLSVDWSMTYRTIDTRARSISQRAFLRNLARGEAYLAEAPTLWDVTFRTAVAQAELEDRERPGAYHHLLFHGKDGADGVAVEIATTRPELLPACVALVAHPDDERYRPLFGRTVRTPLFGVDVPVLAHPLADPEKGTGVAMVCTFGDTTDVVWWRELQLATRPVIGFDGRFLPEPPPGLTSDQALAVYAGLAGATAHTARERIVAALRESGELLGEPRPVTHAVKFYEKGDRPLEIVTTRQWYLRNGGRDEELRARLLARGDQLRWSPGFMKARYDSWVSGLNGDWLVSRQRFFGVPIPVWYELDERGAPRHDRPLVPDESRLPVDPSTDVPEGYHEEQRGVPGGFVGDPDVLDTWATSSLTPLIAGRWGTDQDLFTRVFPMDLRPQAHEIIRTWLFSAVVRADSEFGELPFRQAAVSGWILDPDRKKMSKSVGNVVTPNDLLVQHGSDAVRYWAASARPGTDTAFDPGQMKIGRRLAIKLLNASKFVLTLGGDGSSDSAVEESITGTVTEPIDRSMLAQLAETVAAVTDAFDALDHARALERTETFFWRFCDDYLELVKSRAYGDGSDASGAASARAALRVALSTLQRLFAPVLPFAAEEVWSWWQQGSVHTTAWPDAEELRELAGPHAEPRVLDLAAEMIAAVRKAKSEAQVSMRTEVAEARVTAPPALRPLAEQALADVRAAGRIARLAVDETPADADGTAPELAVSVVL
ncbi:valine--tRNA ligase [Streptacidiphilus fuscans]|uniref:Valine--tRNA ligase n=1 Tax=Streptacidiphilus fuscans TaxID=2789292 RepID=A0A931B767_9ACTN|nr:valine--tRNA ligase [Streptacidiphilus fuscans]MBF9071488.1 valine--tRNA ligase [Streptacidiphilus fuscans]